MPSFSSIFVTTTRSVRGTAKRESPRASSVPSSVRARTSTRSAPPFVLKIFVPVSRKRPFASSTGAALVATLPSAEPASASESDMQVESSPDATPGTKRSASSSLPKRSIVSPQACSA